MQAREVPALPRPARGCSFGEVSRRVLPPIWGLRPSPLILQLICGDVQYGNMHTLRTCRTGAFRRDQGHRGNYADRSNPSRLSRGRGKCHRLYTSRACAGSRGVCWFYRICISVSWVTPAFSCGSDLLLWRHSARGAGQEPRAPRRACRWPYLFIWPDIRRFALLVGLLATSRPSGPAGAWLLIISLSGRISPSSNFLVRLSTTARVS